MTRQLGNSSIKTVNTSPEDLNYKLDLLASELAYNYYSNSFGAKEKDKAAAFENAFFADEELMKNFGKLLKDDFRVRNILIVGAGASYDSFKCMPLGRMMQEAMKKDFEEPIIKSDIEFLKDRFTKEKEDLEDLFGGRELSFENYFYLLSSHFVNQSDLRESIKKMTDIRYAPSLFNEIVAHLLKHAFLDVVINFNFEETLDQAIEDEIGAENYYKVISDGHVVDIDKVLVDGRLKSPIYIKPHGTNSHKSTLRFTNNHYFDLPGDIKEMLKKILKGKLTGKGDENKKINRINLIVAGFALESVEFNKLLKIKKEDKDQYPEYHIYHIDHFPFDLSIDSDKTREFLSKFPSCHSFFSGKEMIPIVDVDKKYQGLLSYIPLKTSTFTDKTNRLSTPFAELMSVLWRKVHNSFSESYAPRSIARHEIISYLLYDPGFGFDKLQGPEELIQNRLDLYHTYEPENQKWNTGSQCRSYFSDKLMVELMLAINRNNGAIDIGEMLKGRIGFYYREYEKMYDKVDNCSGTIYDMVNWLCGNNQEDRPAYLRNTKNYCFLDLHFTATDKDHLTAALDVAFGFEEVPERSAFINSFIRHHEASESDPDSRVFVLFSRLLTSPYISARLKKNLLKNYRLPVQNGLQLSPDLLSEIFRLMYKSLSRHYYIINPRQNNPVHHLLESYSEENLHHTNMAYSYAFSDLFCNLDNWDAALVVSETGGSMKHAYFMDERLSGKRIILICSYEAVVKRYPDLFSELLRYPTKENYEKLKKRHFEHITGSSHPLPGFELFFAPSREHNHHMAVFLKKPEPSTKTHEAADAPFLMAGALYHYRQGYSNSIDPVVINACKKPTITEWQDYGKLLSQFYGQHQRAHSFEYHFKTGTASKEMDPSLFNKASQWDDRYFNRFLHQFIEAVFVIKNGTGK